MPSSASSSVPRRRCRRTVRPFAEIPPRQRCARTAAAAKASAPASHPHCPHHPPSPLTPLALLGPPPSPYAVLEVVDAAGNTPLLLSYRMGRTTAARMLLAAGAAPKARARGGWEAVQVAALTGNTDLIRSAVLAFLAETDAAFSRRLPGLQAALAAMPDFTLRMSWQFNSWVPLLGRLLPSDTYSVHKRGSSLRLDTTLLGMSGLKWERGSVSLLLWGSDMPRPGAMFVLDNEMKTAADARLAFTHPQDVHIQDWVRKLLTQKAKATDYWARDTAVAPVLKEGLLGGFLGRVKSLALGDDTPRGRVSEGDGGGAGGGADDGSAPPAACTDPRQVREDVAAWSGCAVYELRNLCVRDLTHPPILADLKLADWWRPEYSRQATDAEAAAMAAAATGGAGAGAGVGAGVGTGGAAGAAGAGAPAPPAPEHVEAPEKLLKPLHSLLRAIRLGKINEANAASATMETVEGFVGDDGAAAGGGFATAATVTFEDYFGMDRPTASLDQWAAAGPTPKTPAGGLLSPGSPSDGAPTRVFMSGDGRLHRPTGRVCDFRADNVAVDDKSLDAKVFFAKDFPLTTEQFLPVAEIMARTSRHAANIRRFFSSKLPAGAGFPVRFTLPVFPTVTATVTFDFCDPYRPPAKSLFTIPDDFKMGAYVERGFIRQL
jgi:hypothetical protein